MLLMFFKGGSIYGFKMMHFGLLCLSVNLDKTMETRFISLHFFNLLEIICVENDFFSLMPNGDILNSICSA